MQKYYANIWHIKNKRYLYCINKNLKRWENYIYVSIQVRIVQVKLVLIQNQPLTSNMEVYIVNSYGVVEHEGTLLSSTVRVSGVWV